MATNTYVALDKVTVVNTTTSSVTFTGISGSYTDLQLVISGYTITGSGAFVALRFNSDTASNYSATYLWGNGTTATSGRQTSQTSSTIGAFYSTQANIIANVQNYSNSTTYKTAVARSNSSADNTGAFVSLWRNTAAITSMTVLTTGGEYFNNGATFSLYGILAEGVSPAPKASGGTIYSDATYYYHAFGASGTFNPTTTLSCDVLVIAGGGSGSWEYGGGGGAGGLCYQSGRSITSGAKTVTIGAGGAFPSVRGVGNAGTNSVFDTITANGGGRADGWTNQTGGGSGGSGGGGTTASSSPAVGTSGGSATQGNSGGATGYGNAGGAGYRNNTTNLSGGGGGGAGGAGASSPNGVTGGGGNGGVGLSGATISALNAMGAATGTGELSGGNYYYAGGGGGYYKDGQNPTAYGNGGLGGGGTAVQYVPYINNRSNGAVSTGGGGGGDDNNNGYGSGGSGLVIIRYAKA